MLDFILITLIFLEITGLYFLIGKIIKLNEKIKSINNIVVEKGKIINELHIKIQKTMHKINFFVSIFTNKKLQRIRKIISSAISIFEVYILIKSFNFKKGVKFNLKNLKKLLFARLSKQLIKKIFNNIAFVC